MPKGNTRAELTLEASRPDSESLPARAERCESRRLVTQRREVKRANTGSTINAKAQGHKSQRGLVVFHPEHRIAPIQCAQ